MAKTVKPLLDKTITNAVIKDKPYELNDGQGLILVIRPSGTKVWQYKYKFNGIRKTNTLGRYTKKGMAGHVSLKDARRMRFDQRDLLDQNIDPIKHKKELLSKDIEGEETTFAYIAREWHNKGVWVPKHAKNILSTLEADVFPIIGDKQLNDITRPDIIAILEGVESRDAKHIAKRISIHTEGIFEYALIKGICDYNPALGISKYVKLPAPIPRPFLTEKQLPEFLHRLDTYHGRDYIKMAMKLLVLTFLRPGEIRNLHWSDIDEENAILIIPKERMKMNRDHSVPLSKQALSLIRDLKQITGKNELLFPGINNNRQPISDVTLTKVLQVMGYTGKNKVVPHGFRHTASTILNEEGFNADYIERQLAHVEGNKIRGTYNHAQYLEERRKMMQWWADYLGNAREAAAS